MGMFDDLFIHESLIHPLVDEYGFELDMDKLNSYFQFQTKDLDNLMTSFFIEEDGSFVWEKINQEYNRSDIQNDKKDYNYKIGNTPINEVSG